MMIFHYQMEAQRMSIKSDFILNEALSMSPSERAKMAHCLIHSLDDPSHENVDADWIQLAEKRLKELESSSVEPISWDEIKLKIRS